MLARELSMTVARLRRAMSGEEFAGWRALYELEAAEREKEIKAIKRRRRG